MKEWTRYPLFGLHARLKHIVNDMKWTKFFWSEKKDWVERGTPAISYAAICSEPFKFEVSRLCVGYPL
jgi:hypothetical protein